MNVTTAA